jgi:hypothetical protein
LNSGDGRALDDHLEKTWPKIEAPTAAPRPPDDQLTAFLYLLMRDHLPIGVLHRLAREVEDHESFILSNRPMVLLARDLAGRLR